MDVKQNKLVARSSGFSRDFQNGMIAYSVAESYSILTQAREKLDTGEISEDEFERISKDMVGYMNSSREFCVREGLSWEACEKMAGCKLDGVLGIQNRL